MLEGNWKIYFLGCCAGQATRAQLCKVLDEVAKLGLKLHLCSHSLFWMSLKRPRLLIGYILNWFIDTPLITDFFLHFLQQRFLGRNISIVLIVISFSQGPPLLWGRVFRSPACVVEWLHCLHLCGKLHCDRASVSSDWYPDWIICYIIHKCAAVCCCCVGF